MNRPRDRQPPRRWAETAPAPEAGGADLEARVGALFRRLPFEAPLPRPRLAPIARARQAQAAATVWLRAAVAAALLLGTTTAVFARHDLATAWHRARTWFSPLPARPRVAPPPVRATPKPTDPPSPPPRPPIIRPIATAPAASPPRPPAPAPAPESESESESVPVSAPVPVPAPPHAPDPPQRSPTIALRPSPPSSTLAAESALLRRALLLLRQDRDPRAALAALEDHRARFPGGRLADEVAVARVETLLALDRRADALEILAALPLEAVGRGDELRVIRAELRSPADCAAATRDFDQVLSRPATAPLAERALHGRAACRLSLGDTAGAASDLRAYLARYPHGRFASEIRRKLADLGP